MKMIKKRQLHTAFRALIRIAVINLIYLTIFYYRAPVKRIH